MTENLAREIAETLNHVICQRTMDLAGDSFVNYVKGLIATKLAEANKARDERDAKMRRLVKVEKRVGARWPDSLRRLDEILALLGGGDENSCDQIVH